MTGKLLVLASTHVHILGLTIKCSSQQDIAVMHELTANALETVKIT